MTDLDTQNVAVVARRIWVTPAVKHAEGPLARGAGEESSDDLGS
jgi:hypothetical protein